VSLNSSGSYDAIIIGAGIGGLVCGCYLAKAGMKVLMCEQHSKAGGYCTSFKRKGFTFDAAAHSFGGYREGGVTRKILNDLEIDKKIVISRSDPSDIVNTPGYKVSFWNDLERTKSELAAFFPEESNNIKRFFSSLLDPAPNFFTRLRRQTFKHLLDQYFTDENLKVILSVPLLGNGGLPPSQMSAFIGAKIFSEYLLDGGYSPAGGMQTLSDALAKRFEELGGELRLSRLVKRILVKDDKVAGVVLEGDGILSSRYVISACDARQTFLKLIGEKRLGKEFLDKITKMVPSTSIFVLYLGINGFSSSLPPLGTNVWFLPRYDLDETYSYAQKGNFDKPGLHMVRVSHDSSTVLALIQAPFKTKTFWFNKKHKVLETLIKYIETFTVPHLSTHIKYKEAATPWTLHRYTLNYKGSPFGWAGTPSQLAVPDFKKPSFIQGLYLTGHWTTQGLGISGVVYVGHDVAKTLLKKTKLYHTI